MIAAAPRFGHTLRGNRSPSRAAAVFDFFGFLPLITTAGADQEPAQNRDNDNSDL
jgi:hypothetical protein